MGQPLPSLAAAVSSDFPTVILLLPFLFLVVAAFLVAVAAVFLDVVPPLLSAVSVSVFVSSATAISKRACAKRRAIAAPSRAPSRRTGPIRLGLHACAIPWMVEN